MRGSTKGIEGPPIAEKEPLQGIAQVLHQVEPIDDLDSLGRPLPNPLSIEATAIAANDLDARVCLQPLRDRGGRALREQIHHLMALESTHDGPEPSASPPGPFVDPNDPWSLQGWERRIMNQTHKRPETPW